MQDVTTRYNTGQPHESTRELKKRRNETKAGKKTENCVYAWGQCLLVVKFKKHRDVRRRLTIDILPHIEGKTVLSKSSMPMIESSHFENFRSSSRNGAQFPSLMYKYRSVKRSRFLRSAVSTFKIQSFEL